LTTMAGPTSTSPISARTASTTTTTTALLQMWRKRRAERWTKGRGVSPSAIIAAQPAIEADDEDASYAIAAILALGAISLFTFPLIGHSQHLSDKAYGLWAGLAVDN